MTRSQRGAFMVILLGGAAVLAAAQTGAPQGAADLAMGERLFHEWVAPTLERKCLHCHHGEKPKGGLSLEGRDGAMAGGASGLVIVPGDPASSLLWQYISGDNPLMPQSAEPLSEREVFAVGAWITAGAPWPAGIQLSDKRSAEPWWSLEPLTLPEVPHVESGWVRNPIDTFVLSRLHGAGLQPSSEADRRTLLRRLFFDLHGLPPTPEETEAFLADDSPHAYERLVDRLLASPRFGERYARHWLDVVHFGESHGYDKDKLRPNAWPYRDYVIRAFNEDKPYARFVQEQLAGDVLFPDDPEGIVATGFIAAGPWDFVGHVELREGTRDKEICRSLDRDDMVATTMSTFTSLTVHCARCHDHKFDPIPQVDYYRIQAVFAGVERADRAYDRDPVMHRQRRELLARQAKLRDRLDVLCGNNSPKNDGADSSDVALAELRGSLAEIEYALETLPKPDWVYAAAHQFDSVGSFNPPAGVRPIHVLARGSVDSPGILVGPGALGCVAGLEGEFCVVSGDEGARRAALAAWLTDRNNMLTWRSIANRLWLYHFGEGLVDTPNDFGRMGSKPSHPELLDWLAVWLRDHGGSLKGLHRLMVTSATYRQSTVDSARGSAVDGSNRLLWRMNRRRLEAECVRDAVVQCAGNLDLRMGGPSARQYLFEDDHSPRYDYANFDVDDPAMYRRSVYRFLVRSVQDPFMARFDCADPSLIVPKRTATLTAIQALAMLNNPFIVRQAEHCAQRLQSESDGTARQVEQAYRIALCRLPSEEEMALLLPFTQRHGLAAACRVLFNLDEFMFVD